LKPRWVVSQTYSPGPGLFPLRELSGRITSQTLRYAPLPFDKLRPSLRATGRGDLFPVRGMSKEEVAVFASAGGQHQVIAFVGNLYTLLDELTYLGLVCDDFYFCGSIYQEAWVCARWLTRRLKQGVEGRVVKAEGLVSPCFPGVRSTVVSSSGSPSRE